MELRDISDWAPENRRSIYVTHDFGRIAYKLHVARFHPTDGDMLQEAWTDRGILKTHSIPPYAIIKMEDAAMSIRDYVDRGVKHFMTKTANVTQSPFRETYEMALKQIQNAKVRDPVGIS